MSRGCRILLAVVLTASTMIVAGRASAGAASTTTGGSRPITGLTARATGPNSVRLRWNRPLASATARIVVRRMTVGAADGRQHRYTVVLAARSATFLDLGTTAGTKYEYTVRTAAQQSPPETVRVRTPSAHPGPQWSAPVAADPTSGQVTALACAAASQCTVGDLNGYTAEIAGSTWSTPTRTFDEPVTLLSCAANSFCLAEVGTDDWWRLDDGAWSQLAAQSPVAGASLSCASGVLCAVGGWGDIAVYDGSTWIRTDLGDSTSYEVSCAPGADFCMAVDSQGRYATYTGGAWSTPTSIDTQPLDAVSCLPDESCVAIDGSGRQLTYDGSTWTSPGQTGFVAVQSVSCASTTECIAVTTGGDLDNYIGGQAPTYSWGFGSPHTEVAIDCQPGGSCLAASRTGMVADVDPSKDFDLGDQQLADPRLGGASSLTCVSARFCAAVHGANQLTVYRPSTGWRTSAVIEDAPSVIACRTASWCTGLEDDGRLVVLTGGPTQWTTSPVDPSQTYSAVACGGPTICAAVTSRGRTAVFRAGDWHFTHATRSQPFYSWLTCARSFCMVAQPDGAEIFDGTVRRHIPAPAAIEQVSCATPELCLGVTTSALVRRWDGRRWFPASHLGAADVACGTGRCVAATTSGRLLVYSHNGWTRGVHFGAPSAAGAVHVAAAPGGFAVASSSDGTVEMLPATTG